MCIRRRVGGGSELSEIVYISTRLVKSYELGVGIYADNRVDRLLMSLFNTRACGRRCYSLEK